MHESAPFPSNGYTKGLDMSSPSDPNESKRSVLTSQKQTSWFELPAPIRQLFDTFPLFTYDENPLPQRIDALRKQTHFHMFTLNDHDSHASLSLNPACVKWQAYLLINHVPFSVVSANNHASPSGSLPFILPSVKSRKDPPPQAIVSSKIYKWAQTQGAKEEPAGLHLNVHMALIDVHIRNAWLYNLYLLDENFETVAKRLYIRSASSNRLVQLALAYQLKAAALDEVLRTREFVDEQEIFALAEAAFKSLCVTLGEDEFFSRKTIPGLFDLALFSYTYPLLALGQSSIGRESCGASSTIKWKGEGLYNILKKHKRLVSHHDSVLALCTKD